MNRCTLHIMLSLCLVFFLILSDFQSFKFVNQAFAGGRGRRYVEDDTNDREVKCQREKLKKERLGKRYVEPKICDQKVPVGQRRGCLDSDCDINTGQIRY